MISVRDFAVIAIDSYWNQVKLWPVLKSCEILASELSPVNHLQQDLKLWQKNHCLFVTWVPRHGGRQYLRLLLTSRSLLLTKTWRLTLQRGMRGSEGQGRREPLGQQGAIFFNICSRLEICQKIYTTGFSGQKFYTLKVPKLQMLKKQRKCINISYFSSFFVRI